jgi:hypothetical protein
MKEERPRKGPICGGGYFFTLSIKKKRAQTRKKKNGPKM